MKSQQDASQESRSGVACNRREFLAGAALAGSVGLSAFSKIPAACASDAAPPKAAARVRVLFVYPPSRVFADDPNGWWSWPGNEFDAESRQADYTTALNAMAGRLGMELHIEKEPVASEVDVRRICGELTASPPDGVLLVMFYNRSLAHADALLRAADEAGIPAIFYIGLGVKHGPVDAYRRSGVYLIQSLDNMPAVEDGLRMINTRKLLKQSLLLSINEAPQSREQVEPFLGVTVRVIPYARYAEQFEKADLDEQARETITRWTTGAMELRGVGPEALENALRAHLALKRLIAEERADGLTMDCLSRGVMKPCVSFATLNGELIPAACENDLPAAYTQLLGQLLTGRPGFQHNPAFETEKNHYYASHCTCPTAVYGPGAGQLPYLLRRFAHTNEGSCAIQVFWKTGEPVTIVRYYPGDKPTLDVYAGKVVQSHAMPPAAGCTTNVEIEITDRADACAVRGHHNLVFCGDFARRFRMFARLHRMELADTGYAGPWPA